MSVPLAYTNRDSPGGTAACDAASVYFGPTIRSTVIIVLSYFTDHFSGPGRDIDPVCVSVCPDNNF